MKKIILKLFCILFIQYSFCQTEIACYKNDFYKDIPKTEFYGFLNISGEFMSNGDLLYPREWHGPTLPFRNTISRIGINGKVKWTKHISKSASISSIYTVVTDEDESIITGGGYYESGEYIPRGQIFKIDSVGKLMWSKVLNEDNANFYHIIQLKDGNILSTILSLASGEESTIMKMDKNGKILWQKKIENIYGTYILELKNGGFLLAGYLLDGQANSPIFVMWLNKDGDLIKTKGFKNDKGDIYFRKIIEGNSGELYMIGRISRENPSTSELGYLMKIDSSNKLVWAKQYDGTNYYNFFTDIVIRGDHLLADGVGYYYNKSNLSFGYMMSINKEGELNWSSKLVDTVNIWLDWVKENKQGQIFYLGSRDLFKIYMGASTTIIPSRLPMIIKADEGGHIGCFEEPFDVTVNDLIISETSPNMTIDTSVLDLLSFDISLEPDYFIRDTTICFTTATQDPKSNKTTLLKIYPSPASAEITISLNVQHILIGHNMQAVVTDVLGRKVYSATIENNSQVIIPVGSLNPGYYTVSLISVGRILESQKLIVTE